MINELPKLFDRNFVIAYLLPMSLFSIGSVVLLKVVGIWQAMSTFLTGDTLIDLSMGAFIIWIASILLMVLNRDIYRALEGYGKINPLRIFEKNTKKEFNKKKRRLSELDELFSTEDFADSLEEERENLLEELATKYPDHESFLLPTAFGNVLRAFEVYPRVMYGLEGIDGWPRVLAAVPKDYRELIDDAKAQVDWWVNLGVLSFLFLVEFWAVVFYKWGLTPEWYYILANILLPLFIFVMLNYLIMWRAISAAIGWGDYIKSSFDLYRFKLIELLGINVPTNRDQENSIWISFSQAIIYRLPDQLPELKKQDEKKKTRTKTKGTGKR